MEALSPIQRFFKLLQLDKQNIINISIYAVFNGLIALSLPLGIQAIINFITGGQFSTSWFVMVFIVILGIVVAGIMQILQLSLTEDLQQKIFTHSAYEFTYRIPRINSGVIEGQNLPSLVNRFFDTITLQKGVSKVLLDFSRALLQVVFGIVLLSLYHPFFIIYGLFLLILLVVIFRYTAPMGLKSSIYESKYKYELAHWLQEVARSYEAFKMSVGSHLALNKSNKITANYLFYRKKHFKVLVLQYSVMVGFKVLITGGLLILGGVLVINQKMNIGQFVAAEIIIILLLNSVEKLILSFETIYDLMTGLDKIGVFSDLPLEDEGGLKLEVSEAGIHVRFNNFSFKNNYSGTVLKDIDLNIKEGDKVALAGLNRSGKSTLLKAASGMYREFEGAISYNNLPIGNIDVMHLRHFIGDNLGNNLIFEGTVGENITMGREGVSQEEIDQAIDLAGLRSYVENLQMGYNQMINVGGNMVSHGVYNRLVLARIFVQKPKLILLEDPFDVIDNESTDRIIEYLYSDKCKSTVIFATSRRKYLKLIDEIILMDRGRIIDKGNYQKLVKNEEFTFMVK